MSVDEVVFSEIGCVNVWDLVCGLVLVWDGDGVVLVVEEGW